MFNQLIDENDAQEIIIVPLAAYRRPNHEELAEYILIFNLGNLRINHVQQYGSYHSFGQNGYVFLEKNIPNHEDRPDNHTGWKIHVSIDINQVFNGMSANYVVWGVIMPVLIMKGVYQFKVALHDVPAPEANNAFRPSATGAATSRHLKNHPFWFHLNLNKNPDFYILN